MKFLSLISSLSFHPVVFISLVGFIHFSFCLSPPNSRFSLEDQLSNEDLGENESQSRTGTTPISTSYQGDELQTSNSTSQEEVTSESKPLECECGVLGSNKHIISSFEGNVRNEQTLTPFILNGKEVFRGEFPFLAALTRYSEYFAPKVICAASLVNSKFLITAAHCIKSQRKDRLRLVFNAWKISPFFDVRRDAKAMILKIKRLIPHPKYNPNNVDNDIGLIELEQPFDLLKTKDTIRPVCLPASTKTDYTGANATVAGWGYTFVSGGLNSPTIQKANVPIWSQEKCRKTQYGNQILAGMLCAGYDQGGTDACTNDSGGPLIVEENKSSTRINTLVGIISWGHSCGLPALPGVYSNVSNYLTWIDQHINSEGNRCVQTTL